MYPVRIVAAVGLLVSLTGGAQAKDAIIPLVPMTVDDSKNFIGKKDQPVATDMSGMACVPPQGDTRNCLAINDENKGAQFAALRNDRLVVGKFIPLIVDEDDPRPFGSRPHETCGEEGEFKNLDGEGVAYAEPFFYVVGSHGCSRRKNKFELSSFILARIRVDSRGRPVDTAGRVLGEEEFSKAVQTTYRVSDWLQRAKGVKNFFAENLEEEDGLNIEGVAVHGDRIWFGLRAPVKKAAKDGEKFKKRAFVVGGDVADLFEPGDKPSKVKPEVAFFDLDERGIRDLAVLADGRLLVLAGAPNGDEVLFKLFIADPKTNKAKLIGTLAEVLGMVEGEWVRGKAESVTLLDVKAGVAQAVILFDGLENGKPHLAKFAIPD
jgi:hypothetical protein